MITRDEKIELAIERNAASVMDLAEWLNAHPETGGNERASCLHITDFLKSRGYEITLDIGDMPNSFRAEKISCSNPAKKRAALMCEYDALPEVGHACGHSLITAMSVMAAIAIDAAYPDFPLTLDLIGTPDEESSGGKVTMAANGVFDGYEFALMGHPDNFNAPQIKVLACAGMYLTFTGKAAHASSNPWDGANALNAAQIFMHATDALRQHLPKDCQIHGIIVKGGSAPNTVPDITELDYYYRAAKMEHLPLMKEKLENCARGAAIATGCTYTINHNSSGIYADLSYLPSAIGAIKDVFDALGQHYREMEGPEGSTDAGNVDLVIPAFHLEIAATDEQTSFHTAKFAKAMRAERGMKTLRDGSSALAHVVKTIATTPGLLEKIKAEHKTYRK
jgi:amidohydrolase